MTNPYQFHSAHPASRKQPQVLHEAISRCNTISQGEDLLKNVFLLMQREFAALNLNFCILNLNLSLCEASLLK